MVEHHPAVMEFHPYEAERPALVMGHRPAWMERGCWEMERRALAMEHRQGVEEHRRASLVRLQPIIAAQGAVVRAWRWGNCALAVPFPSLAPVGGNCI